MKTEDAIEAIDRIGLTNVARHYGINKSAITGWKKSGVPIKRARSFAKLTGLPLYKIRPDFWDQPGSES